MGLVVTGARVMTCAGPAAAGAARPDALGLIERGAVAAGDDGRVAWVGPAADLPAAWRGAPAIDARGRLITPGLVDCHAHPLFAGDRAAEFALRARGAGYQEIAAAGGGINATLGPTRAATTDDLVELTRDRMRRALAAGTTTMEAKSGYDLTLAGEVRLLEVARAAARAGPIALCPTLLAHLIPPEARGSDAERAAHVRAVTGELVPRVAAARLADAVDVYCDEGAFTLAETRAILEAARAAGLAIKAHVGQFADLGGAELCAELGARSADHLEQVSPAGVAALAAAGTVAVMLPGACVQLRMAPPPVARLRAAGVALAVATDLNPGTSYSESLPIAMWLATTHYGMTVEETWLGVTRIAARALGRTDVGTIAPGGRADLVLWDADEPAAIPYHFGADLAASVWIDGALAHGAP